MVRPSSRVLPCVLLLLCFVPTFFSQDPTSLAPNRTNVSCSEDILIVTGNSSGSMIIQVERTNSLSYTALIPGCHVPYVCSQVPGSCNWARVGPNYFAVSGNRTLVFVKSTVDHFKLSLPDCDPINLLYKNNLLWVACKRESSIHLLQFFVEEGNNDRLSVKKVDLNNNVISSEIGIDPYPIFIHGNECPLNYISLVLVDNSVMAYFNQEFREKGGKLVNCSRVEFVSYLGGSDFTVYCSGGLTATFDICISRWNYHNQNEKGRFYHCGGTLSVRYSTEHIQLIDSNQGPQNHSVGSIIHGECNRNLFFVVSTLGDVYATSLTTGTLWLTFIDRVSLNSSCGWPYLDQNSLVILSEEREYIFVVTVSKGCLNLVRKERRNSITDGILLPLPFSTSTGHSDICQCLSGNQSLEMTTTDLGDDMMASTEDTAEVSRQSHTSGQGDVTKSTAKTETSVQGTTTDQLGNNSRQINRLSVGERFGIGIGVIFSVISIVIVVVVASIFLAWRLSNKCCFNSSYQSSQNGINLSDSITVESQPVENTAHGRDGVGACSRELPWSALAIPSEDVQQKQEFKSEEHKNDRLQKVNYMLNHRN